MGEIRENQSAKLSFKTASGSEKEFDCSIKKIYSDRISLDYPRELVTYSDYLQEGDEVNIKILTPSGIKMFDAMILDSPINGEFIIESVADFIRIQRRKYLRMPLKAKIIIEREDAKNIVTQTLDISGGGIRFEGLNTFYENENVGCMLFLPRELSSTKAQGIILKTEHLPKNQHVMLFTKIMERDRDKIIKVCFEIESGRYKQDEEIKRL